jgi:hypothetical protein
LALVVVVERVDRLQRLLSPRAVEVAVVVAGFAAFSIRLTLDRLKPSRLATVELLVLLVQRVQRVVQAVVATIRHSAHG